MNISKIKSPVLKKWMKSHIYFFKAGPRGTWKDFNQYQTSKCKNATGRGPKSMMDAIMVNELATTCKAKSWTRFVSLVNSKGDAFWKQQVDQFSVDVALKKLMTHAVYNLDFIEMHANRECTRKIRRTDFTLQDCTGGSKERYEELVADYWSKSDYAGMTRKKMKKAMSEHNFLPCEDDAGRPSGKQCTPLREQMKSEMRGLMNDAISQYIEINKDIDAKLLASVAEEPCWEQQAAIFDENSFFEFPEMEECVESVGSLAAGF